VWARTGCTFLACINHLVVSTVLLHGRSGPGGTTGRSIHLRCHLDSYGNASPVRSLSERYWMGNSACNDVTLHYAEHYHIISLEFIRMRSFGLSRLLQIGEMSNVNMETASLLCSKRG
jgi:hypothetical protein